MAEAHWTPCFGLFLCVSASFLTSGNAWKLLLSPNRSLERFGLKIVRCLSTSENYLYLCKACP